MSFTGEERVLIDGTLRGARAGASFETINPATEEVLGVAADCDLADLDESAWIAGCPRCRGHLLSLAQQSGFEPEVAFADLNDNMKLGEQFVEHIVQTVLDRRSAELKILERDFTKLEAIRGPFPRISYDEAVKILERRGVGIPWGEDFGAPHETALGEEFGKPVRVKSDESDTTMVIPPMKLRDFTFTSLSDAV